MVGTKASTSVRRSQRLSHGAKAAALATAVPGVQPEPAVEAPRAKRAKVAATAEPGPTLVAPASPKNARGAEEDVPPLLSPEDAALCTTLRQPKLAFDLQEARAYLCAKDPRFVALFAQMDLKMYEELRDGELKELNLFRVLTTSILGQQISWLAARSILYKFCRVFAPHLEEKPDFATLNRDKLPFPAPHVVLAATDEQLRTAGLSSAKIRYVRDVARRFADGRLDVRRIVRMSHDECVEELTRVKGVGRWTAEMLLMFALRFPNVLPVGDLGVQRGMVYFYTSGAQGPRVQEHKRKAALDPSALPADRPVPLPSTQLSLAELRARANGQKTKKKMYLDPHEMEELAAPWAPFRSVACMFMWSLVDAGEAT
ncbi:DNA-3-methyladenine glycosylase II [Malassezia obtusa]|uniref:DNA-3-methyladenine glycosylase II n=1 Tax=Malassezia obtusa TaxID=76774 RepID=A0AAF0ISI4_9BASI|nr:DNA-3-methyladenine glycosylase II [Malassezia obtusa]